MGKPSHQLYAKNCRNNNQKCIFAFPWPSSSTGYPPERTVRYGRGISDFGNTFVGVDYRHNFAVII